MSELAITPFEEKVIVHCAYLEVQPKLTNRIRVHQNGDTLLTKIMDAMERFTPLGYSQREDGLLLYQNRICVPVVETIR